MKSLEKLEEIVEHLRDPEKGCPWDRVQTHESIKRNIVEETYEVIDAITSDDPEKMKEEFGDLLLQIVFHTQIEKEKGNFNIDDVINTLCEKLIRRHPHVFGSEEASNPDEVLKIWNKEKDKEKDKAHIDRHHVLDDIPLSFPPFLKARKYGERACKINFDWRTPEGALEKIKEELDELMKEAKSETPNMDNVIAELGDVMFATIQYARKLKVNNEEVLNLTCEKFRKRLSVLEDLANGRDYFKMTDDELDELWEEAKKILKNQEK